MFDVQIMAYVNVATTWYTVALQVFILETAWLETLRNGKQGEYSGGIVIRTLRLS